MVGNGFLLRSSTATRTKAAKPTTTTIYSFNKYHLTPILYVAINKKLKFLFHCELWGNSKIIYEKSLMLKFFLFI